MNIKLRLQNKAFWITWVVGIVTILGSYLGLTADSITTWERLFSALSLIAGNPLVLAVIVIFTLGSLFDFTVPLFKDSGLTLFKTNINQTAQDVINLQLKKASMEAEEATVGTIIKPETTESEVK